MSRSLPSFGAAPCHFDRQWQEQPLEEHEGKNQRRAGGIQLELDDAGGTGAPLFPVLIPFMKKHVRPNQSCAG